MSIPGILKLGFASTIAKFDAAHAGTAEAASLPRDADVLILWGFFHGGQAGDTAPT